MTITQELRLIETEIDNYYKSNPLTKLPFGVAMWYYMAFCEDVAAKPYLKGTPLSKYESAIAADLLVVGLKNPFKWLLSDCSVGGKPPLAYSNKFYQSSHELFMIGDNYNAFELAFTYANRGLAEISIEGTTIVCNSDISNDLRYEAYDRISSIDDETPELAEGNLGSLVEPIIKVSDHTFSYNLKPKIISEALVILESVLSPRFSLPADWDFGYFSLDDFKQVANCLIVFSYIHFVARMIAAKKGCKGYGYANSIFLSRITDLENRLVRYTNCNRPTVARLIELMTYGEREINRPDPAIQPIVRLNPKLFALMPNLLIPNAIERNFIVLLNKLPEERSTYLRLVFEKEALMREEIKDKLSIPVIRSWHGDISTALPDIDLAIIDDVEKTCLILEMKWFIDPSEPREVIEKSQEISKGISQLTELSKALDRTPHLFLEKMGIDSSYDFVFAVDSKNFVGMSSVQNQNIPVIRHSNLIKKINADGSLKKTMDWLSTRKYLPTEGKHYKTIMLDFNLGKWGIHWAGFQLL